MTTETWVFLGIALVVIVVIVYMLMAHLKGKIELVLAKNSFQPGEVIQGQFSLLAKKPISGNRLVVRLTAREEVRRTNRDGKTSRHAREIYSDEKVLDGVTRYDAGYQKNYSFELTAPQQSRQQQDSLLFQSLRLLGNALSGERRRIDWMITVCLDAQGIDITDSQKVYINWGHSF